MRVLKCPCFPQQCVIEATDNGDPPLAVQKEVTITLLDVDDNLPQFTTVRYLEHETEAAIYIMRTPSISQMNPIFSTLESRNAGDPFGLVTTTDADLDEVNRVAFYYFIGNFVLCNITSC